MLDHTTAIVIAPGEPEPIQHAAEDLANDFRRVTGEALKIVSREQDAAKVLIMIGEQSKLPAQMRSARLTAPEAFSISVQRAAKISVPRKHSC